MNFADRRAVVTGAASGMGAEVSRRLQAAGASIARLDVAAFPAMAGTGPTPADYRGDLRDAEFVASSIEDFAARHDGVDLLVNAAGVLWFDRDRSLLDVDLAVWREVLDINLNSMMHTSRYVVPAMRRRGGGAMVHISSTQCLRGDDRPQDAYQAAKAAIIALSKSLAIQLAADGIRSNVLVPGPTETPLQARWDRNPEQKQAVARTIPLGRLGTVDDMANAVLFLLSEQASFITGTELLVDGGLLARP